ncbi:hypothetical protein [Bacillus suaedaesalsae]|uniref:Uncharacterized protein n=1 Tax=Bacillus suaedaesalsae TaxID=2810349 RepID=A0ABS2DJ25_9BACI|nr:hypothetical protein [Bacillus suaedaesalsae]MBM6618464.1 hypothetical protein [Bacillus suaedaesalsae]
MGLFLIAILYWLLIGISILSLIWGIWRKSWKALLISGLSLFGPTLSLYVGGAEGLLKWSVLAPLMVLLIAYFYKNKE